MSTQTILLIVLAGIAAILVALFQYKQKNNKIGKLHLILAFLRFLTVFLVLLLLINPKFKQISYYIEKPVLSVVIDNSSSILHLNKKEETTEFYKNIVNHSELNDRFDIHIYKFGNELESLDSLTFSGRQTNISNALSTLDEINRGKKSPVLLISDGNQTYGANYEFFHQNYKHPVYPVIIGDTVKHTDLKIEKLNVNKYSYLKNKFPLELIITYNGEENVDSKLVITLGNTVYYEQPISLSKENNSKIVSTQLPAKSIGVKRFKAEVLPVSGEKNLTNNRRMFAVEVIDQRTDIAIISDITHPDLGALKKSIETNEQRTVKFLKPNEININKINDFELVILYQPNNRFKSSFDVITELKKNYFIIIGTKTDLRFLNNIQPDFNKEISSSKEDILPVYNDKYSTYLFNDIKFNRFPPLEANLGDVTFTGKYDVLLYSRIGNIDTERPLLTTFERNNRRSALLLGENIWKWRAHNYLNTKNFEDFDIFIGKLIQYLASSKRRERLNVNFESFYYGRNNIKITAEFFDKNYVFNPNESLQISLKDKGNNSVIQFPMLLKGNYYEADLSSLPASEYEFTVRAVSENISKTGIVTILDFEVEQQFVNANVTKLNELATHTGGKSYFLSNFNQLFDDLIQENQFAPIQKPKENIVPLIDWKWILGIIALTLSIEWFLRKYYGLV